MPSHLRLHRLRRFALLLGSTATLAALAACGASDTSSAASGAQSTACATATTGCAVPTSAATAAPGGSSSTATSASAPACTNKATNAADTFQNSVTLVTAADGLQSGDIVAGTGAAAASGQQLTVNYTGWLSDGTIFDSSCRSGGTPFSFALGQGNVIKGWDEGLVGLKVGGFRRLVIPPALGYGSQGAPGAIPANATLTFDVELVSVK